MRWYRLIKLLESLQFYTDTHESHPEETVFHHAVQAYEEARRKSDDHELWVAALFHDIGKTIETHGHEKLGVDILQAFGYYNERVLWLIERHMRIRWMMNGRLKKKKKIQEMIQSPWIGNLVLLRRCDGLAREVGRTPSINHKEVNSLLEETNERRNREDP